MEVDDTTVTTHNNSDHCNPDDAENSPVPAKKLLKDPSKDDLCNGQKEGSSDESDNSNHGDDTSSTKVNGKGNPKERQTNGVQDIEDHDDDKENAKDNQDVVENNKDNDKSDTKDSGAEVDCKTDKSNEKTDEKTTCDSNGERSEHDVVKEETEDKSSVMKEESEEAKTGESTSDKMEVDESKTERPEIPKTAEEIAKELEEKKKEEERLMEEEKRKLEEKKLEEKRQKFKMFENCGQDTEDMRPMASLLYSMGADLAKQQIFKDLVRVQTKKKAKNLLQGSEDEEQLEYLKKSHSVLVEKNKRFVSSSEVCSRCQFKSESKNVMEWHLEFAHGTESNVYQCCFCDYNSRYPADFFFHVEQEHRRKGRIYMKPAYFCCPLCPFEHNSKAALNKHKPKCERNFNLKRNLEPSPTDCDIPLKKLKTPVTPKPAKTVIQLTKPTVTKPTIAQATGTWQQPRVSTNAAGQVRMPIVQPAIIGAPMTMPQMPVLQQRPVHPVVSQYTIGNNVYTLVNSQGQFVLHQAGSVSSGGMTRAPGVGMVAPTTLSTTSGMVRLQVPVVQVSTNQSKPVTSSQPKSILAPQTNKVTPSKGSKSKSSSQTPQGKSGQFEICEICGGFVKDRESLRIHFYWAHKVDINKELFDRKTPHLICEFCPQRFWTYQGYTRHRQMNHKLPSKEPVWKCPLCRDDNIANLLTHLNQKHNISLNMICHQKYCPMCGLTFKNEVSTKQHLFTAHKQMFEKAVAASLSSPNKGSTTGASPVPTGLYKNAAKTYEPVCSLCDMTFPTVEAFSLHCAKMHLFRCYRCGQKWNTAELLQAHFRQVHGNEQEKCQLCTSKLTIGRPYIRHLKRSHLKECSVVLVRLPKSKFELYHKKYLDRLAEASAKKAASSNTVKAVVDAVLKNTQAMAKKMTGSMIGSKTCSNPVIIDLIGEDKKKDGATPTESEKDNNSQNDKELCVEQKGVNKAEADSQETESKAAGTSKDEMTMEIDGETIVIQKEDDDDDEADSLKDDKKSNEKDEEISPKVDKEVDDKKAEKDDTQKASGSQAYADQSQAESGQSQADADQSQTESDQCQADADQSQADSGQAQQGGPASEDKSSNDEPMELDANSTEIDKTS